jgi:hypothetical protein
MMESKHAAAGTGVVAAMIMNAPEPTEVEERYYENNRHFPIIGWSTKLLPTDRWYISLTLSIHDSTSSPHWCT